MGCYVYKDAESVNIIPIEANILVDEKNSETIKETDDKSWQIKPAIMLKKTDGKNSVAKMTVYVSYFSIFGGLRYYTMKKTASCTIKMCIRDRP